MSSSIEIESLECYNKYRILNNKSSNNAKQRAYYASEIARHSFESEEYERAKSWYERDYNISIKWRNEFSAFDRLVSTRRIAECLINLNKFREALAALKTHSDFLLTALEE